MTLRVLRTLPIDSKFTIPHVQGGFIKLRNAVSGTVIKPTGRIAKTIVTDDVVIKFESESASYIICDSVEVEVTL